MDRRAGHTGRSRVDEPTGRTHTDRPEPVVRFVADPEILERRRALREPWLFSAEDPPGSDSPF
ncbi:hypothetical protein [Microbacterium sp. CPCC 204701]|uniref:hypothetical protein n=1 Tax=Microbacterium sp. CPCC 204701 TaxID=2493084 RepID=UPI000FDC21A6|nr:hypothetical protein [Microbacterium sp. CPCC 204701]